ncbi:DMT family transporter [Roseovarius sp. EL26]|uniref:DMT family transporter n=1 Tax=Roseovarius sp. EL26 TaxID=2126672 RepID=UPI0020B15274|nr:DMT family transporter [Roseovarius sp. EL26]
MMQARSDDARTNRIGSFWMVLAMIGFAVEDALLKGLTATLSVAQVLVMFGSIGMLAFAVIATSRSEPIFIPEAVSRAMCVRYVFEIGGRLFYVLALALTPLSSTTAILQATPIVLVAGAALFFGETVGWRRWSAVGFGLIGVLVVLRPAGDSFTMLSVLAVLGMLGFAGRDLASRAAPAALRTSVLGFYGFAALIVAGLLYGFWEQRFFVWPQTQEIMILGAAVCVGIVAYSSLMLAMRTGEISAVAPFRYSRLLFGIGLGMLLFDESIDLQMIIGCSMIVASGLYILWRGNRIT